MATRKKPCSETVASPKTGLPPVYYKLHALLQTMRALQCHEDDLCTVLAAIQRSGKVGAGLRREILRTLDGMPVMSLHADLDACLDELEEAAA